MLEGLADRHREFRPDVTADQVFGAAFQHLGSLFIDEDVAPVPVKRHEAVGDSFHELLKARALRLGCCKEAFALDVGELALADVDQPAVEAMDSGGFVVRCALGDGVYPHDAAVLALQPQLAVPAAARREADHALRNSSWSSGTTRQRQQRRAISSSGV